MQNKVNIIVWRPFSCIFQYFFFKNQCSVCFSVDSNRSTFTSTSTTKSVRDQWDRLGIGQLAYHGISLARGWAGRPNCAPTCACHYGGPLCDDDIYSSAIRVPYQRRFRYDTAQYSLPQIGVPTLPVSDRPATRLVYMGLIRLVAMRNIRYNDFPIFLYPSSQKKNTDNFYIYKNSPREWDMDRIVSCCLGH